MRRVLLCVFLVVINCGPSICQGGHVSATCDVKLNQLLDYHQGSVPELQQQVAEKIAMIDLLNAEILHAENTLKLVSDSAADVKRHELMLIQTNEDLKRQVKEKDAEADEQRKNILSVVTDIYKSLVVTSMPATQCDNLQEEINKLRTELNTANANIKRMVEETKVKEAKVTVEKYRKAKNLANDIPQILDTACKGGDSMVVASILDLGVDCGIKLPSWKSSCLHLAAGFDKTELVRLLLARGCNKEIRDAENYTPLMYAAWWGRLVPAQVLVDSGVNLAVRDTNAGLKLTALGHAKRRAHAKVAEYLKSKGAPM